MYLFPYVFHGLCEDYLTCDIAFNAVMPLSRASTRGRYSRIEGVIRRWRWLSETRLCPRSLPRLLGLGAREGRRLHRASPASSASLHLQRHQATSFKVLFLAGSAHRAALFPGRVGPSLRHVSVLSVYLGYLVGGAPRAALSPSRLGQTQWHVSSCIYPS